MEARKWEDLNSDYLVNVFKRLDLETRLLDIPLVCKNWYQTLLNPFCWQELIFPVKLFPSRLADYGFECGGSSINISALIKFDVDRSEGCATKLALPEDITQEDLIYVLDACPSLKTLSLPEGSWVRYVSRVGFMDIVSDLIVKWKSLEVMKLRNCSDVEQVIDQISLHCPNFVGLSVADAHINQKVASAIGSKLPTMKYLALNNTRLEKKHLKVILLGCKELELLYVRNCVGFDEKDEEIIKLASQIKDFRSQGSRTYIYDDYDYGDEYLDYADYLSDYADYLSD